MILKIFKRLSRPDIAFYLLLWLIALLIVGTIAQKYIGLYQAQIRYFSSFYFVVGFIPLPGGYTALSMLSFSLTAKLLIASKWRLKNCGVLIVHSSAVILLFGGMLTALFATEGNMVLTEGQTSNVIKDYHKWELVITKENASGIELIKFDDNQIRNSQELKHQNLDFVILPLKFIENVDLVQRPKLDNSFKGFGKIFSLNAAKPELEQEINIAGFVFKVINTSNIKSAINGKYAIYADMPKTQTIGNKIKITLSKQKRKIPFSIHLLDFVKEKYPSSQTVKSFSSEVEIRDNNVITRKIISMNKPLRYRGYTFYQASFLQGAKVETTVLAVVNNIAVSFPYIASIIMAFGLLILLLLKIPSYLANKNE